MNTIDILGDEQALAQLVSREIEDFVDDTVTTIGSYAFSDCSNLTSVDLPNVTSIVQSAFRSCSSLTSVDFPNVTTIGNYAFKSCSSLTSVDFPNVTSIGSYAFDSCSNLNTIILRANSVVSLVNVNAIPNSATIYVPDDLVESYKTANNWSRIASRIKGISELPTT